MAVQWVKRIVGNAVVPPGELVTNDRNFCPHPDSQKEALRGVIDDIGFIRSATVNQRTERIIDGLMVDLYYRLKRENGYTREEIDRKRFALEGVLVPVTARWNEELLRGAGFRQVDYFWRWMNFAGWIAVKE